MYGTVIAIRDPSLVSEVNFAEGVSGADIS